MVHKMLVLMPPIKHLENHWQQNRHISSVLEIKFAPILNLIRIYPYINVNANITIQLSV
jgi:hypothetical protein